MRPLKYLIPAAVILLAAACSKPAPDPWAEAIGVVVRYETGVPLHVESATRIDSTTFITELNRRRGIYELRIMQNGQRQEKYSRQNMPKNARIMREAIKKDYKIIAGLDSIRRHMGADTLKVAYYDYEFEYCTADEKGHKTKPKKAYATLTPRREVLTWSPKRNYVHKTTGLVIPGYRQLLDDLREEEER